ncbi:MAG: TAXI family TRAP transporter solute-binding subunit [Alphaproteobacteria bacterium]
MSNQTSRESVMRLAPPTLRMIAPMLALCAIAMAAPPRQNTPAHPAYFSIATGTTGSSYFPLGSIIATILSHPTGSVRCDVATACGPEGLVAVAVASQNALADVRDVTQGRADSAFIPADIANWAYNGTEIFKTDAPLKTLRAIARLYPEPVQLVVARGSGIKTLRDLKQHRVAGDVEGSATSIEVQHILGAVRLTKRSLAWIDASPDKAAELMRAKKLDAFFLIGPAPSDLVGGLINDSVADLLALDAKQLKSLTESSPYLVPFTIPAGSYTNVADTPTLAVGALWVVRASVPADLIYQLTGALWDPSNRAILQRSSGVAENMALEHALDGVGIPLHPGAARFYLEKNMLGLKRAATEADAPDPEPAKTR